MLLRKALSVTLFASLTACASGAAQRLPSPEAPPADVVRALDAAAYSPVSAGLTKLEADLLVDITGFFPSDKRPAAPVVVPVRFVWNAGKGAFTAPLWGRDAEPLKAKVLATLKGKEDDFVGRSYQDRLAELRVEAIESDDGRVLAAAAKGKADRRTYLYVSDRALVERMTVIDGDLRVDSVLTYEGSPAVLVKAESRFSAPQPTVTEMTVAYGRAGKYLLPSRVVYRTTVGTTAFPPLAVEFKNVEVR